MISRHGRQGSEAWHVIVFVVVVVVVVFIHHVQLSMTIMSYGNVIFDILEPMTFKNIAHDGSFKHF